MKKLLQTNFDWRTFVAKGETQIGGAKNVKIATKFAKEKWFVKVFYLANLCGEFNIFTIFDQVIRKL